MKSLLSAAKACPSNARQHWKHKKENVGRRTDMIEYKILSKQYIVNHKLSACPNALYLLF